MVFRLGITLLPADATSDCEDCQREYKEYIFDAVDLTDLAAQQKEYCKKCTGQSPQIVLVEILHDAILV